MFTRGSSRTKYYYTRYYRYKSVVLYRRRLSWRSFRRDFSNAVYFNNNNILLLCVCYIIVIVWILTQYIIILHAFVSGTLLREYCYRYHYYYYHSDDVIVIINPRGVWYECDRWIWFIIIYSYRRVPTRNARTEHYLCFVSAATRFPFVL